jgi:ABC-type branched-subunit amino acid transport system ATPase component
MALLSVQNIKKQFGGIYAVNDCSFDVKKGLIVAIIGPNGSGKSTLFNLISGVMPIDSGQILLNKKKISNKDVTYISNAGASRVFQKSRVFGNLTVRDNLILAFDNEDVRFWKSFFKIDRVDKKREKIIDDFLGSVEISGLKDKLSGGLSFGQKRLIELFRAIINPHKLLILDEPVAGIIPALKKNVLKQLFLDLKAKGDTMLIIEHDVSFIFDIADEVIVMDEGRIIARGAPAEIKANKLVQDAYFG